MSDPQLSSFLLAYEQYVSGILKPTRDELKALFRRWRDPEHWVKFVPVARLVSPSPIQRAFSRIKRPESVVDKIYRKSDFFPDGLVAKSFEHMTDALGARIVVYFMSDLWLLDRQIRFPEDLEISEEHPPRAYLPQELVARYKLSGLEQAEKESGYSSIHYVVRLKESSVPIELRPWIEIQVRTLAQDLWSEIEHVLGYKPKKLTSMSVTRQFSILGKQLTAIDEYFDYLYEELRKYQQESTFKPGDPLNAENLPAVLARMDLACAQKEIDGLLRLLNSRRLGTAGALLELGTSDRIARIRQVIAKVKETEPTDFEVIANLAGLADLRNPEQEVRAITAQTELLRLWDALKADFR